jgi:hypothetical protein
MDWLFALFGFWLMATYLYYCNEIAKLAKARGDSYPLWFFIAYLFGVVLIPIHIWSKNH